VTLARIFTNSETVEGYKFAFIRYHQTLQSRCGITLRWRHLDRDGAQVAIIADQDPKQMAGK
jgi:hypothetical protein